MPKNPYDIQLPKSNWVEIQTKPDWIRLHTVTLAVATPNRGKTAALSSMLKIHHAQGALDRLIIVSPYKAFHNNSHYFLPELPINEQEDVIEPSESTYQWIYDEIQNMVDEYDDYQEKLRTWKVFNNVQINIEDLDDDMFTQFMDADGNFALEKPKYRYSHLNHPPIVHVLFDDVQGSAVFGRAKKSAHGVKMKCIDDIVIEH
jgi:predicted DNA-binding protein YlxM (UPF0122 family)